MSNDSCETQTTHQGHAARLAVSKHAKTATSARSTGSSTPLEFVTAMANLCALKRTSDLTDLQLKAWAAVLCDFPAQVLNRAIIEVALTKEKFPDVGDLYQLCRNSLPRRYSPHGDGKEFDNLAASEIAAVAERLGLKI